MTFRPTHESGSPDATPTAAQVLDVIIVGAGLSGIGAAVHLQQNCPQHRYAVLEGRAALGGTWDLFRYPGVRSDSDMYTLGYQFRPWTQSKAIASGENILQYITDTARDNHVLGHIRFNHRVVRADWSSAQALWTLTVEQGSPRQVVQMQCKFLLGCSGYFRYDQGYTPAIKGLEDFTGRIIHPQHWPHDLDYAGKRVVVIGSGATAMTLVPSMAKTALHVTMLQRSPTYVIARASTDKWAQRLQRVLPEKTAYGLIRLKNVLLGMLFFRYSIKRPQWVKSMILNAVRKALPEGYDVEKHFSPNYKPWDQRVCLVPDADLFKAIRAGSVTVVTDHIVRIDSTGICLKSGEHLEADLIVTATGLELQAMGAIAMVVDDKPVEMRQTMCYKGMMLEGVPNFAYIFGYANASWTLKADLVCTYVCKVLNHMAKNDQVSVTPRLKDASVQAAQMVNLSAGYVQRSLEKFPVQGHKKPWRLFENYIQDSLYLSWARVDDGVLVFEK